jgi:hypothetical protein
VYLSSTGVAAAATASHWDNTNGRLGIGTTSPGSALDVVGGSATPVVQIHDSSSGGPDHGATYGMVNLTRAADTVKAHVAFIRAGNFVWQMGYIQNTNSFGIFPFNFSGTQGTPTMTWSGANVGIGTTSPAAAFDVAGKVLIAGDSGIVYMPGTKNTGRGLEWYYNADDNRYGMCQDTNGIVRIFIANAYSPGSIRFCRATSATTFIDLMTCTYDGKVGIGTTAPGSKLEVNGSMYQQGGNAYLGYDNSNQIFLGLNRTGAFCRFNDDMWFGDPQNGVIQVLNGVGAQWGTLQGFFTNMSTRASKKDVTTFDQTKLESLYQDTIDTKICSWRYKEEADYVPLKYGPILDDSPPYFTVTPDG